MENPGEDIKAWVFQNAEVGSTSCAICSSSDKKYYLASDFSMDDLNNLNVDYMKRELFDLVISLQSLVVLVYRGYSDPDREYFFPMCEDNNSETGANTLNTNVNTKARCGSGRIKWIEIKKAEDNETCSCVECKVSPNPEKEFCLVVIVTAAHVVFNDQEAESVTCLLDYNTDDTKNVVMLRGYKTKVVTPKQDRCEFYAVTHDKKLRNTLIGNIKRYQTDNTLVYEKVDEYHKQNKNAAVTNTVIIISHPHSLPKRISIGEITNVKAEKGPKENTMITQYLYNAMTCEGSSGGPVYIVGRNNVWSNNPHSRRIEYTNETLNASAKEWEFVTSNLTKLIEHLNEPLDSPVTK